MAYKEISRSSGPVFKWDTVGQTIEGVYRGIKAGKTFSGNSAPSKLAQIEVNGAVVTTGAPTMLAGVLTDSVPLGSRVRITYLGQERGQNGANFKNFKIEVDGEGLPSVNAPILTDTGQSVAYGQLLSTLRDKVGPDTARLMSDMLDRSYPDVNAKIDAVKSLLKQQGVTING